MAEVRAKLAPGTPVEVWFQDEMRVGQKTNSPIAGPGRARVPEPLTISAPNRPTCSVRYVPNTEPALLSSSLSATPKPCSFISMRSLQE